jgi:hypothetical protein
VSGGAIQIQKGTPPAVIKQLTGLQKTVNKLKSDNSQAISIVERTVASTGTGAVLGYIEGRYGRDSLGEIPLALIGFAGLHAVGFWAPEFWGENMHAAGDGCSTVYAFKTGLEWGRDRKAKVDAEKTSG